MWGWSAPGSRGQLPPDKPDDQGTQRAAEQRRGRRVSPLSVVLLVVLVAFALTFVALFVVYLTGTVS
jgi:hypothetical protein